MVPIRRQLRPADFVGGSDSHSQDLRLAGLRQARAGGGIAAALEDAVADDAAQNGFRSDGPGNCVNGWRCPKRGRGIPLARGVADEP